MKLSEINWQRGLTRLYLLAVIGWFLYWTLWVPLESVRSITQTVIMTSDVGDRQKLLAQANFLAQWREMAREIGESPIGSVFIIILPPVIGYGLLRLSLVIVKWLAGGFKPVRQ